MMCCTLAQVATIFSLCVYKNAEHKTQMLYWRLFHAESNLYVGITLSMMGFMSLQTVAETN